MTNASQVVKPKRTVHRVMIDAKKDNFYADPYIVVEQVSLTFFDPTKNSNKFYVAEIHQSDSNKGYRYYASHGRIGAKGRELAEPFNSLESAQRKYNTKVSEKLRNGYIKQDLATSSRGSDQAQLKVNPKALKGVVNQNTIPKQKQVTPPKIAKLVTQIYEEANQAVSLSLTGSVKTDIKAPLGTLGINGINAGRQLLAQISQAIRLKDLNFIRMASIEYYRNVPRKMPSNIRDESTWILNTNNRVTKEMDILDLYEDTLRMLPVMGLSDIDSKYQALNTDIRYINPSEELMSYINHKVTSTIAPNHAYKLRVVNAFEVNMKNAPQFNTQPGNVRKLFHGSRSANLVGILSSHLKLPNNLGADVHKTGAMFGPGIYFASDSSKSYNYSSGHWVGRANKHNTAFLMIAEVALGNVYKTETPGNFTKAPTGHHSVMGVRGSYLRNHEFIVYDPTQVRVRYLIECEKY